LPDSIRSLLQQPAGYWILPKLAGYEEEKLLFSLIVMSATEKLYCLYQRSDDSGRAQVPSIYLRELCRPACGRLWMTMKTIAFHANPTQNWTPCTNPF